MPVIPALGKGRHKTSGVQRHPQLHSELEAKLEYRRPSFKKISTRKVGDVECPMPSSLALRRLRQRLRVEARLDYVVQTILNCRTLPEKGEEVGLEGAVAQW